MSPEQIASVCHEANRAITAIVGDVPLQPSWSEAPEEMKRSSVAGVKWRLENRAAPASDQHEEWMRAKLADGWQEGPVKDAERKTHPALVPYWKLSTAVQQKDAVFTAIVLALA